MWGGDDSARNRKGALTLAALWMELEDTVLMREADARGPTPIAHRGSPGLSLLCEAARSVPTP